MKKAIRNTFFPTVCIFLFFTFPLSADSPLEEQVKTLLEDFSEEIIDAGGRIEYFETLLLSTIDDDSLYNMEVLRFYLEEKIEELKKGKDASTIETSERIGSGGSVPRGDLTIPNINKDADLLAILGKEYTDSRYQSTRREEPFSLIVRNADGAVYPVQSINGRNVIMVKKDSEYRIVVENLLMEEISASIFIDGINTLFQERELPSAGYKWVVDPLSRLVLPGWQHDNSRSSSFRFIETDSEAAATLGYADVQGLITAVFYVKETQPPRITRETAAGFGENNAHSMQEVYTSHKKAVRIVQIWYEFEH